MAFDTSLDVAINTATAPEWTVDAGGSTVSPNVVTGQLVGGGYFTAWAADVVPDGIPDAIAVQRYTATGIPTGPVIQLGNLPIKQLVGSNSDLRDLFSIDALNGGGYSLAYRVPVPQETFSWTLNGGASVAANLAFTGKPTQFTVSIGGGTYTGLTFVLRGTALNGSPLDVALTPVGTGGASATISVSAAVLAQFGNPERLSLVVSGSTANGATIGIGGTGEENWRYFADNSTSSVNLSTTAFLLNPGAPTALYGALLTQTSGRTDSFHITSVTAGATGNVSYVLVVAANTQVRADLGLFVAGQTQVLGGLTYTLQPSGAITIAGASLVPDANGNIALPTPLRTALDFHDASISLFAQNVANGSTFSGSATVIAPTLVDDALYTRVYDATGALVFDHVIDTSAAPEWSLDSDGNPANPHVITGNLANGGYYVSWLADANHDGTPEGIAVQKFAADGTPAGGVVQLGQLPLLQLAGSQDDPAHLYDVEVLGSGGFAMSYQIPAPHDGADYPALNAFANGTASLFFVGKPESFIVTLGSGTLANAAFALRGMGTNGQQITVNLAYVATGNAATITVSPTVLAQFANPERVSLAISGLAANTPFTAHAELEANWRYAGTEALSTAAVSGTAIQTGVNPVTLAAVYGAFIGSTAGRAESFHVGTVTAASGSPTYGLTVVVDGQARSDMGLGAPGTSVVHDGFTYTLTANGTINVTGPFTPDGSGNVAVPAWLLSTLRYHDAGISLAIGNLAQGSAFSGDVTVRAPTVVTESLHTRVYDSAGNLQFDHAIDTTGAHEWVLDRDGQAVNPNVTTGELAGGGYYTSWLADTDSDGLPETIAVQRFDASGNLVGGVVKLAGLPLKDLIGSNQDAGQLYSVDALPGGGYTASFSVPKPEASFGGVLGNGTATIGSVVLPYADNLGIIGRPESINVAVSSGSLNGLQFQLVGLNAQGVQTTVNLAMTNLGAGLGSVAIAPAALAGFANPERVTFKVVGLTSGQTVSVNGVALQDQRYFDDQATATVHVDGATSSVPTAGGLLYFSAVSAAGRVEAFHIASAIPDTGKTIVYSLRISGDNDLSGALGLAPGLSKVINGVTYTMQLNGSVSTSPLTPDGNGNIAVPVALLDLLEYHDAGIVLLAVNLAAGSVLSTDITYRTPLIVDDGLYTRTYDSAGNITKFYSTAGADLVMGGVANDQLDGQGGNDTLHGGGGNDSINGGTGVDVATYDGAHNGVGTVVVRNLDHSLTVTTSLDGTDTLHHVEQVRFADGLFSYTFGGPGAPVVANFNPANGWVSQNLYPRHVADMNGDGYADIVGFGAAGTWISYGSSGGTFAAPSLVVANFGQGGGWATDDQYHRELADVNGDGKADILGFGYAGTWVSLAGANGTFSAPTIGLDQFGSAQGWTSQNGYARVTGDINGDGKADIVGFGFAGTWSSLSNGDGTFKPVQVALNGFGVAQGWTSDNSFHRTLADVNGDGKADLVGFGIAGTWVALSKGDGTFADAQLATGNFGALQGWSTNDSFPRLVADVNGDHIADIVGFGIAGTWVSFGKGDGTFTDASFDTANFGANQGWSSDGAFHREVADINHDGLGDLVGFGIAGVFVGLNQGDFLI